jgi:dolichol kinase
MSSLRFEARRKGWHMVSGVLFTPLIVYTNLVYATILMLVAALFILILEVLRLSWGIHLPFWSRQLERTRRAHEVISWASISFLATIVILIWLAPLPVALAAAAQLALGDGVSALVGKPLGRHKIWFNRDKSWEGSGAGFLAGAVGAFAILAWYYWQQGAAFDASLLVLVCIVGSFFAMLAESLPRFEDNVTVPLLAGVSMTLLWWALGLTPVDGELVRRLTGQV